MSEFFDWIIHSNFDYVQGNEVKIANTSHIGRYSEPVSVEEYKLYIHSYIQARNNEKQIGNVCKNLADLFQLMFEDRDPKYIDEYNKLLDDIGKLHKLREKYNNIIEEIEVWDGRN